MGVFNGVLEGADGEMLRSTFAHPSLKLPAGYPPPVALPKFADLRNSITIHCIIMGIFNQGLQFNKALTMACAARPSPNGFAAFAIA
jgi:hypothetical protein